mgnify:CR=1 FL=1
MGDNRQILLRAKIFIFFSCDYSITTCHQDQNWFPFQQKQEILNTKIRQQQYISQSKLNFIQRILNQIHPLQPQPLVVKLVTSTSH